MPFVSACGHRLEYQVLDPSAFGAAAIDRAAPTLVFLHEGLGSSAMWKDFPHRVAHAAACPALIYSRHGYGKSDRISAPRGVDYMHREALQVLPEVLAALSIEDPILVGHSDGASIALIYAGAGIKPVRGLVLMAPHVFVEDMTVTSIAEAKTAFETTDLPLKLCRYHAFAASTFWGWNDIWLHPDFRRWNIEQHLSGVDVPALLIQGEDDPYGTLAQVDAIARQVGSQVDSLILPNCGHSPHVDQRDATISAIADFAWKIKAKPVQGEGSAAAGSR